MTTTTMNTTAFASTRAFAKPSFADIRAALPDMPAEGSLANRVAGVVVRAALAAVPFVALGSMFFVR
jgi:hypothetical protein